MFQKMSHEIGIDVEASCAWEFISSIKVAWLIKEELPNLIQKMEVLEGDGGVGTRLKLTFTPEFVCTEQYTRIDDENRVKEAELVEGGYLELGFTMYRSRIEVIESDPKSCVVNVTIKYELKEEAPTKTSIVNLEHLVRILEITKKHLLSNC